MKDYLVLVMDATVATGAAAMMAIRVLLDHDVPEQNIVLVSLLMAESGNVFVNPDKMVVHLMFLISPYFTKVSTIFGAHNSNNSISYKT